MIFHAHTGFLEGGGLGVEVFFVLSGFLITWLLCAEADAHGNVNLKFFYARRGLRLGPALLLLVIVYVGVSLLVLTRGQAKENIIQGAISLAYLSNWARAFDWHAPNLLGHTWSLSIEEQFYLLWPLILLAMLRVTKTRAQAAALTLALAALSQGWRIFLLDHGATPERLFNGLDTRSDALMIGCALALMMSGARLADLRRYWSRPLSIIGPLALVGLCSLMLVSEMTEWREPYMHRWGFAFAEICAVAVLAHFVVNGESWLARIFNARWLRQTGAISYGLYLWHYPVYRVLRLNGADPITILTVGSIITLAFALLSYRYIEQPVLRRFKSRFDRKRLELGRPLTIDGSGLAA